MTTNSLLAKAFVPVLEVFVKLIFQVCFRKKKKGVDKGGELCLAAVQLIFTVSS